MAASFLAAVAPILKDKAHPSTALAKRWGISRQTIDGWVAAALAGEAIGQPSADKMVRVAAAEGIPLEVILCGAATAAASSAPPADPPPGAAAAARQVHAARHRRRQAP